MASFPSFRPWRSRRLGGWSPPHFPGRVFPAGPFPPKLGGNGTPLEDADPMTARTARLGLVLALIAMAPAPKDPDRGKARAGTDGRESPVGASFKVPYRLTNTNHFLVRIRIDGKG